jgi:hypothetical protein
MWRRFSVDKAPLDQSPPMVPKAGLGMASVDLSPGPTGRSLPGPPFVQANSTNSASINASKQ